MKVPVAILAGGLATRLFPLTTHTAKALIPIAGKPFAVHQLELLRRHGFQDVVFCVGHLGHQVQETLGDGSKFGMRVRYSFDGDLLLGTGGALRRALPLLADRFMVIYGDSYLDCDYDWVLKAHVESARLGLMTVFRNDSRWDRSNVHFEGGVIRAYDKQNHTAAMAHIDYGLGLFESEVFRHYPDGRPFDLVSVYQHLLLAGQLTGLEVKTRFYEIGSTAGLKELESLLTTSH